MSDSDERLLDRPIWSALTTRQKGLAEGGPRALRYPVAMTPFADMVDMSAASFAALGDLLSGSQVAALFTPEPVDVPAGFKVVLAESGEQMIGSPADSPLRDADDRDARRSRRSRHDGVDRADQARPVCRSHARTRHVPRHPRRRRAGRDDRRTDEARQFHRDDRGLCASRISRPRLRAGVARGRRRARSRRAAKFRSCTCSRATRPRSRCISGRG